MRIASLSTFEVFRLRILGLISGRVTVLAPEVAGDVTVRLPSTSGTLALEGGSGATTLAALTDVDLTSPSDADVLTYDAGSSTWKNAVGGAGSPPPVVVDLDTADLLTLHSSPVELIAAPGVGRVLIPVSVSLQTVFVSRPFLMTPDAFVGVPQFAWGAGGTPWSAFANYVQTWRLDSVQSAQANVANAPMLFESSEDAADRGGIDASVLNAAGADYAPGDTGTIGGSAPQGAVYVVDTVLVGAVVTYHIGCPGYALQVGTGQATTPADITPTIISVNQGAKKFGVQGDFANFFALPFTSVTVAGSTGNDGTYTIVSAAYAAGVTLVTVLEAIPSAVADGTITAGQAGSGDAAFTVDVSAIVPGDGSARVWISYFIADLA